MNSKFLAQYPNIDSTCFIIKFKSWKNYAAIKLEFDQRTINGKGVDIFSNHTIYQYLSMSQFSMLNIPVLDIASAQH